MAERDRIGKAIKLINPDALFSYNGEDIDSITWHGGTTPISKTDIEAKLALVDVLEKRKTEYLSWQEQLDKLWHDINDGKFGDSAKTGTWYTHIKSVKDANSKG